MKNALLLPLRYLLRLLICIVFSLLILYCSQLARGTTVVQAFGFSLHETAVFFPFLVLCGLFLISFMPLRRPGNMVLSFLLLFLLSAILLTFGSLGLDALSIAAGKTQSKPAEKTTLGAIIRESDNKSWYALGLTTDEKAIQGLVTVDFDSLGNNLSYIERAGIPERKLNSQAVPPMIINSIIKDASGVNAFIRKSGISDRLIAGILVAFFFCTLWFFPRLSSWPLFGALIMLLAFRVALLFTAGASSPDFAMIAGNYFPAAVGRWLPHVCLGSVGILILLLDILITAVRKKREGRAS